MNRQRYTRLLVSFLGIALSGAGAADRARADDSSFWQVARSSGDDLHCLRGVPQDRVAMLACADGCVPIPWQLNERDADGRLALESGPHPNPDDPPGVIDENDELLWMNADSGRRMLAGERPHETACGLEIHLRHPAGGFNRWVYAFAYAAVAPRSDRGYVNYDAVGDLMTGARVSLGFGGATPQYMALHEPGEPDGPNLLDRLKVRVTARFLGVLPVSRDESDLTTEFVAWHAGPIAVVRRQRQWVRVGFGIRSPTFDSDTNFYRDFAELPVSLRLNFPPTYFFGAIEVRAILDFRDLRGWRLIAPGLPHPVRIGESTADAVRPLNDVSAAWFALLGPDITLVQVLGTSPSLRAVRRRIFYREESRPLGPETVIGELPGVGYSLTEWEDVGRGQHSFSSTSYALPAGMDPRDFIRQNDRRLIIESSPLPNRANP